MGYLSLTSNIYFFPDNLANKAQQDAIKNGGEVITHSLTSFLKNILIPKSIPNNNSCNNRKGSFDLLLGTEKKDLSTLLFSFALLDVRTEMLSQKDSSY